MRRSMEIGYNAILSVYNQWLFNIFYIYSTAEWDEKGIDQNSLEIKKSGLSRPDF
jgi:hypothetical protein